MNSTGISRGGQHWHQQGWTALASAGVNSTGISRGGQHWHQQGWTALASAGVNSTGISRGGQHWHQQGWTALASAGVDSTPYSGHSFRSGAATTAASRGIGDATIKMLGRWNSEAYQLYIKAGHSNQAPPAGGWPT